MAWALLRSLLRNLQEIVVDSLGDVIVAESQSIRAIDPSNGNVVTIAGSCTKANGCMSSSIQRWIGLERIVSDDHVYRYRLR